MGSIGYCRSTIVCLFIIALGTRPVAAESIVNLLRLPQIKLETTSLIGERAAKVPMLIDGNPETAASLDAGGTETVDLVFGFAGETVAPETIAVTLSKENGSVPPARIEVLASTISPQTGFQSLRVDPVEAAEPVQKFAFTPTAARWIMIRLTVAKTGAPVSLAEIEVLGHSGPPQTHYAFSETPARVIDILSRLETVSGVTLAVTPDEKLAFEKAKAGRLDPATFADVALLASGATDPVKRKEYLRRIDALEAKARAAVATIPNPSERADALLRWLHREALAKGYRSEQTNLSVILDDHTFNCVSSAVIYNIIALRLGLDVRAIEVPDHAFSIVYQGTTHMDVETTNPLGFNPARDPRQIEKFEKMTGFHYIPEAHRDERREITEAGLAALIYYNKGVELGRTKHHHDALLAYFRAMSLDPEFASAAKNALATLANWSIELSEEQKWQQALDVAAVGLTLAPKDAGLADNQHAIWNRWGMSLIDAGQPDEAIAVFKRAATALPKGGFESLQAWVYIKPGEDSIKARNWQAAFTATEAGLTKLDPVPREELVTWRANLFPRWISSETEDGHFDVAASVLSRALTETPDDKRLDEMAGYLGQEWAKKASTEGYSKGLAVLTTLSRQFPAAGALKDAANSYVWRQVSALADAGRIDDGLAALEEAGDLVKSAEEKSRLSAYIFDTGAKAHIKNNAWDDAADLYARGLKQIPDSDLLKNNVAYMAQEWQKAAYAKGGTSEVAAVATKLVAKFPGIAAISESGRNQIQRTVSEYVDADNFDKAFAALKDATPLLTPPDIKSLNELIYDNWAKKLFKAKNWEGAADVYAAGLAAVDSSDLLAHNAVYLAQEWARSALADGGIEAMIPVARQAMAKFPKLPDVLDGPAGAVNDAVNEKVHADNFEAAIALVTRAAEILPAEKKNNLFEYSYDRWAKSFMDKKQWQEAVKIYDQGLQRVPDSSLFKHNREYCLAQPG
jgi:tetratricopeptide (TPR) repeat protein